MTYRIIDNKQFGTVRVLFTASNTGLIIAGNTSQSNVAVASENILGAHITRVWWGAGGAAGAHWVLKRGANTVFVGESTGSIDFISSGASLAVDATANVSANIAGTSNGFLIVEMKKLPANGQWSNSGY